MLRPLVGEVHLGLLQKQIPRNIKVFPPPKADAPTMAPEYHIDYTDSQLPVSDKWLYIDPQYPEDYSP